MGIPESQLETWAHQGAVATAKKTHESIRSVLNSFDWPDGVNFEIYLQGSYKNDTNIRSDMDVDVVIQLNSIFNSNLTEEQKAYLGLSPSSYNWGDFRSDILDILRDYYGFGMIVEGNRAIKIKASAGRLPADVLVCSTYRKYKSLSAFDYIDGVTFWTRIENRQVVNYPKAHYENGVKKHQYTANHYKPTVRMFKNIRNYLEEKHYLTKGLTPSYFLECLLYNVPDEMFDNSFQDTFCNAINWLAEEKLDNFVCQNEHVLLFGNTPEQWTAASAEAFIKSAINLWKDW
jgi:hypothetical protein